MAHYPLLPPSRRNNLVMEKRLNNVSVRALKGGRGGYIGERVGGGRMQFREEDRGDGRGRNTRFQPGTHVALSRSYCINSVNCQFVPARRREEEPGGGNKAPFEVRDPRNPICSRGKKETDTSRVLVLRRLSSPWTPPPPVTLPLSRIR